MESDLSMTLGEDALDTARLGPSLTGNRVSYLLQNARITPVREGNCVSHARNPSAMKSRSLLTISVSRSTNQSVSMAPCYATRAVTV